MSSHFLSPFITLVLLRIIFLVHLPVSFCNGAYVYPNCTRNFQCGYLRNITFPFWESSQPQYCGLPGYKLKCLDGLAEIEILSQTYHVLHINANNQTLRISRADSWASICPSQFGNSSLPSNLSLPSGDFNYSTPVDQKMTLFYDCPPIPAISRNRLTCSTNETDSYKYFWIDSAEMSPVPQDLSRCNFSVVVPVLESVVDDFLRSRSTLEDVLNGGFDVEYLANISACNICENSGGICGYDLNSLQPTCFCPHDQYDIMCPSMRSDSGVPETIIPIASVLIVLVPGITFGIILAICCRKRKRSLSNCIIFWKRKKKAQMLVENFLNNYGALAPRRYSYTDIKKITSSFKEKIGEGGYGAVYKGKLPDGRLVAAKLLNKAKSDGEEFINEVESISQTSHVNIVSLLGFCFDGLKRALIYEFMAHGSLEKFIYDNNIVQAESHLGWGTLYQIAVGVARGLEYLHRGCNTRILHFDIKPHNILLDEDFTPKISDFGLAKVCPKRESIISMLGARGTAGYIAPEVFSRNFGGVSYKSDVYSYGMMVLEMVGGRKNIDVGVDHSSQIYFPHWIHKRLEVGEDLGLQDAMSKEEREITRKMIVVALWCIQTNPLDRPTMRRVAEMLEGRSELLSIPPQQYLSSPPNGLGGLPASTTRGT